jgi:hypothetical protein
MNGLLNEEEAAMRKNDRRRGQEQSRRAQLRLPFRELVREALFDTVIASAGVLEAERSFRKDAGYRALPKLVAALRTCDLALERQRRVYIGTKAALNEISSRYSNSTAERTLPLKIQFICTKSGCKKNALAQRGMLPFFH